MTFADLALIEPLLLTLAAEGYAAPTPIQAQAIPALLAGRDVCGTAQTGTGKTAAFALPILQRLALTPTADSATPAGVRALILAPTRELAAQLGAAFSTYSANLPAVRCGYVFGGMKQRAQRRALEGGLDVLVATPGRLLDLCGQGIVNLDSVEVLVLDEADRMLDLGFITDVRAVVKRLPRERQTALFSATMPRDIEALVAQVLRDPVRVSVAKSAAIAEHIDQTVYFVERPDKRMKLLALLADPAITSAIVFTRTKHGADRVAEALGRTGIRTSAIHGDKVQTERTLVLAAFARRDTRVLVATDVAARGLDISDVSHVINYDVPDVAEVYVHRIGRTARAGAGGVAITLCASDERPLLAAIERMLGSRLSPG